MAKSTRVLASALKSKKDKVANPFELKVNRKKHNVLGRQTKGDRGNISRAKTRSIQQRVGTLLKEYKDRSKVSSFSDKRFGENDASITPEEKMMERFVREKRRNHEKAGMFQLEGSDEEENEELTHYGQSLSQMDEFDNMGLNIDDDEDKGQIDSHFVSKLHFGGGEDKIEEFDGDRKKSRREIMDEIIAKSKLHKQQRQKELEETMAMTDQLDDEFQTVMDILAKTRKEKNSVENSVGRKEVDDYDASVRALKFEMRGRATDRLKTEKEVLDEERLKLERLERDRQLRMKGILSNVEGGLLPKATEMSGDALGDDFEIESKKPALFYKDGILQKDSDADEAIGGEECFDNPDESDAEGSDSENSGSTENESCSDLELEENGESDGDLSEDEDDTVKYSRKTKIMEDAAAELPFSFPAPSNYDEFQTLIAGRSNVDVLILADRMQKLYHTATNPLNRSKVESFVEIILLFLGDVCDEMSELSEEEAKDHLIFLDNLTPIAFKFCEQVPDFALGLFREILWDLEYKLIKAIKIPSKSKKSLIDDGDKSGPDLKAIMYLRLISLVYPATDFQHPIVTPCIILLCQYLSQMRVRFPLDAVKGVVVCSLVSDFVKEAKRYVPEVVKYLSGIIAVLSSSDLYDGMDESQLAVPQLRTKEIVSPNVYLYSAELKSRFVIGAHKCDGDDIKHISIPKCFCDKASSFHKYVASGALATDMLHSICSLTCDYADMYADIPSFQEVFEPILFYLKCFEKNNSEECKSVREVIKKLKEQIALSVDSRKPLLLQKHKPVPLQFYTPSFDEKFSGRRVDPDRERRERVKLVHKQKKEHRGAIREIRKDNAFLAAHKLKNRKMLDRERFQKVKVIKDSVALQHEEKVAEDKVIRKAKKKLKR
eukprot:Nk52_evm123s352 gene=Nk52_evmTU123s352